jgi:prevent-host-death family protein
VTKANIHEAKSQLSRLIRDALAGKDVVIARDGRPVVRLVPVAGSRAPRRLGGWKGTFRMAEDFDATPPGFKDYMPP